jgi:uncharacterized protein YjiK
MRLVYGLLIALVAAGGCATSERPPLSQVTKSKIVTEPIVRKSFRLSADAYWRLELPEGRPFDPSGLIFDTEGLLTVSDEGPGLFRIVLGSGNVAQLKHSEIFTREQFTAGAPESRRFDLEGLARDERGRLYVCEEATRSIFRFDPVSRNVEHLKIDWSPARSFLNGNANASFEGVAVAGKKLWVANERDSARVIQVDLETLKVVGDFQPLPSSLAFFLHYSDLAWHKGRLFVLLRHQRAILEVDPDSREVLTEYSFHTLEEMPEHQYVKEFPTGTMEGLAVDDEFFWLVTDNNGLPRKQDGRDRRPTLFKCPRPARN